MKYFILTAVTFLFFFASCKKEQGTTPQEVVNPPDDLEILSESEISILDNLPEASQTSTSDVLLPNGKILDEYLLKIDPDFFNDWRKAGSDPYEKLGPQDAKNLLIARMTSVALKLTDRSKNQFQNEGTNKPAQNGLAYSWGSKIYNKRQVPPGQGTVCPEEIYGLDCSGFIYQLFKIAGVTLTSGPANTQRKPTVLQEAIVKSIPSLDKIKVEDLGKIPTSKFETGDIIYWTDSKGIANHIGVVLKDVNGNLSVFQSNGSPGYNSAECAKNMGPTRGARKLLLSDPYWFGATKPYGITRVNADISGKWEFRFRCEGNNPDFAVHTLEFPKNQSSTFRLIQQFVDLDGSNNQTTFDFLYDNTTNILSCSFITTDSFIPDFERKDTFSQKLTVDEIGYFSCNKIYINNGTGCTIEAKLKNLN